MRISRPARLLSNGKRQYFDSMFFQAIEHIFEKALFDPSALACRSFWSRVDG
jgi:hypothetical protein